MERIVTDSYNAEQIVAQLRQNNLTVATAESLTAGMLSSAIADV
ncbi:MAG: CinA family protein, partial [Micrococcus sp.]|nr:CinA family protein [Micrococcus sp.]